MLLIVNYRHRNISAILCFFIKFFIRNSGYIREDVIQRYAEGFGKGLNNNMIEDEIKKGLKK